MILPQDPVQAAILHSLHHHNYEDAIFLSERLFAEAFSDSTLYLLATCYYEAGKKTQAYRFLRSKGYSTARCKYLYGKCCYDIGKLDEAESVLTGSIATKTRPAEGFLEEYGDSASFTLSLLADIYRKTERIAKAVEYYQHSLKLNPFLWSSYCRLCQLGAKPDPSRVFQSGQVQAALSCVKSVIFSPQPPAVSQTETPKPSLNSTPLNTGTVPTISICSTPGELEDMADYDTPAMPKLDDSNILRMPPALNRKPRVSQKLVPDTIGISSPITPSFGILPLDTPTVELGEFVTSGLQVTPSPMALDLPPAPTKKLSQPSKLVFGQSSTSNKTEMGPPQTLSSHNTSSNNAPRRSKRILYNQNSSSVKENSKVQSRTKSHLNSPKSTTRRLRTMQSCQQELNTRNKSMAEKPQVAQTPLENLENKQRSSAGAFLALLRDLGKAYLSTQMYDNQKAIKEFESVQHHQYKTGWVLAEIGKAYLEMAEYTKAEQVFQELRMIEPYQIRGMETYSTVLYHLQKEMAISALAQDMIDIDQNSAETWCVNGNCFSVQKEHDTAIKFLQRAIQINPEFAYAYTLLGHEYTLSEDFDKAMSAFRNAIRVDSRHYNAWYGMGMIYYKKEKFSLAELHFKKALAINPQSSVLLCHIGLVQHALQRHDLALETLNQAVELNPKNPLCLFHRASMLVANDRLQEALTELDTLKVITPKESLVYFLIGKVHKKLGNAHLSMLNFSWATDLDPKGANNHIKEAIDKRYITDDEEPSLDESVLFDDTPSEQLSLSTDTSVVMDADDLPQLQANESDDSF